MIIIINCNTVPAESVAFKLGFNQVNQLADDAPLIDAALDSPSTAPNADIEVSVYPNTIGSQIERSDQTEGWFSRITMLSYEAWLNRGGFLSGVALIDKLTAGSCIGRGRLTVKN